MGANLGKKNANTKTGIGRKIRKSPVYFMKHEAGITLGNMKNKSLGLCGHHQIAWAPCLGGDRLCGSCCLLLPALVSLPVPSGSDWDCSVPVTCSWGGKLYSFHSCTLVQPATPERDSHRMNTQLHVLTDSS